MKEFPPWKWLRLIGKTQQRAGRAGPVSIKQFWRTLERERARANRSGCLLSLVVFRFNQANNGEAKLLQLAEVLLHRVRSTDEIGWFDRHSLGVALPYTSPTGAHRLGRDVCTAMKRYGRVPECLVYCYPSQERPAGERLSRSSGHPGREVEQQARVEGRLDSIGGLKQGSAAIEPKRVETLNAPRTRPLEPYLARPVPLWKRMMDILVSLFILILLCPVFLVAALVIKEFSPGPVIFKQERIGHRGRPFVIFKFRTMRVGADASLHREHVSSLMDTDQPMQKLQDDPRLIPGGGALRRLCIDELPQVINVLRGDMSLVGPRPDVPYAVRRYTSWQRQRLDAVPGITGLWQTNGKNATTFKHMVRLDIAYIRAQSFWLDLKVLLRTAAFVGREAVTEFLGRKR